MQIQLNTSSGVEHPESLDRWATEYLNDALARFSQDITRVEVQLNDENSARKGEADKRCMMEARVTSHAPLAVTHHAATQDEAFRGAAQRLVHLLEHTFGKMDKQHRDRETIRKDPSVVE